MVLDYLYVRCTAIRNISSRYWEIHANIVIGAVGVDIGLVSNRINGKSKCR